MDEPAGSWKQRLREGIAIPASNKRARAAARSTEFGRIDANRALAQQLLDEPIAQGIQRVSDVLSEQGMWVATEQVEVENRPDQFGVVVKLEGRDENHPVALQILLQFDRDTVMAMMSYPGYPPKLLPFPEHADEITEESVARSIADAYLGSLDLPAE